MRAEKPNNPSAFPVTATEQSYHNQSPLMPESGMTLRDYFAAKAMQGLLSSYHGSSDAYLAIQNKPDKIAKDVYKLADEMLKQREL